MSTFESVKLEADSFWNGSDTSGGFISGKAFYRNHFNPAWKSWNGFSVSNMKDSMTAGWGNQYSARTASGSNHTSNYAVLGDGGMVVLMEPGTVSGCYITNSTYAALSMANGDQFAKKFGGTSGDDSDYFRLVATGYNNGSTKADTFYLADYRDADNSKDYIVEDWTYFDLSKLGDVDSIRFSFESSDTGQHGLNTPKYACIDNFNANRLHRESTYEMDFEDALSKKDTFLNGSSYDGGFQVEQSFFVNVFDTAWKSWSGWSVSSMTDTVTADFTNQFSSITGTGAENTQNYVVGYERATLLLPHATKEPFWLAQFTFDVSITNSTYAYKTMRDGNNFAKKFGGLTGDDKDYLVVKAMATDVYGVTSDTLEFYLADYRFDDNSKDYLVKDWQTWNLDDILKGTLAVRIDFWLEGTDTSQWGLNTPAYFCMDEMFRVYGSVAELETPKVNIYPNPASDWLYIDADAVVEAVAVRNMSGVTVIEDNNASHALNTSHLNPGIYVLQLSTDRGVISRKFVKQ
jgi:hypothetical protein